MRHRSFFRGNLLLWVLVLVGTLDVPAGAQGIFIRSDCNQDGRPGISDTIFLLGYLFLGTADPICDAACDTDGSQHIDISDAIALLGFLFLGHTLPPAPFPEPDVNPAENGLSCANGDLPTVSIRASPGTLRFFRIRETRRLTVAGTLADGRDVDLTRNQFLRYVIEPPGIVSVTKGAVVTALAVGRAVLFIRLRGDQTQVEVEVVDSAGGGPTLGIFQPIDGAVVSSPEITVHGWTNDHAATVAIQGTLIGDGPDDSGLFSGRIALDPGSNSIVVTAVNDNGNASVTVSVVLVDPGDPDHVSPDGLPLPVLPDPIISAADTTPPRVTITAPTSGENLLTAVVEVTGTIDDPGAEVRVNGASATVEEGTFIVRGLRLHRDDGRIVATATDAVGNMSSDSVDVSVDSSFAEISFTAPPIAPHTRYELPGGFSWALRSPVHVEGSLGEPGMAVLVNGMPAMVTGSEFEAEVALRPGLERIAAVASTSAAEGDRQVVAVQHVFLDLHPPTITLINPDPVTTSDPAVVFAGRVADDSTAIAGDRSLSLRANGSPVELTGGRFAFSTFLIPGSNTVELVARDGAGRETRRLVGVTLASPTTSHIVLASESTRNAVPQQVLSAPLVVLARRANGTPEIAVPVVFEVVAGDGHLGDILEGPRLRTTVVADASGRAAVVFRTGSMAGTNVVVAYCASHHERLLVFAINVNPTSNVPLLVPRWGRLEVGVAGRATPRPFAVRALDRHGNPVADIAVTFRVISGAPLLGGSSTLTALTGSSGVVLATPTLPVEEGFETVTASILLSAPVTLTLESRTAGAARDTTVSGAVHDTSAQPIEGVRVTVADSPARQTLTDSHGEFSIEDVPWGPLAIEIDGGSAFSIARREVFCVPGRVNGVATPIVLIESAPAEISPVRIFLSETTGGRLSIPGLSGWSLDVAPGAVLFPDGTTRGYIEVAAVGLRQLAVALPDDVNARGAAWILPEGLCFLDPPRLVTPSFSLAGGQEPVLWSWNGENDSFVATATGRVIDDGLSIESVPGSGPLRGGLHFFAVPGPPGGQRGVIEGEVDSSAVLGDFAPRHPDSPTAGVGVSVHSGEFTIDDVDLVIPGRGLDFEIRRHYGSRQDFTGSLGHGWEHEYADRRLIPLGPPAMATGGESPGENLLRADGRGRYDEYLFNAATGRYVSPIGIYARLFEDEDGALVERTPEGTRYRYHALDGTSLAGRLVRITDRNGNHIVFVRDGDGRLSEAIDTLSRRITYEHDGDGRIESVTDFASRTVSYSYDDAGNLVAVTSPTITGTPTGNDFPAGRTTRYEYRVGVEDRRVAHNLVAAFSPVESGPEGLPWLVNVYGEDVDGDDFDRVVAQDWGGTNATGVSAGGRFTFSYEPGGSADTAGGGITLITDPRDIRREVVCNGLGLPVRDRLFTTAILGPRDPTRRFPEPGVDPTFIETSYLYSPEGLLLEIMHPRGGRTVYQYDDDAPLRSTRRQPIRETRYPPQNDPARAITRSTIHDPLFGQVVRQTDWTFEGEGDGPATVHLLDYQEGTALETLATAAGVDPEDLEMALDRAGVASLLGDQNDDGLVADNSGNVVLTIHPVVTLPDGTTTQAFESVEWNSFGQAVRQIDTEGRVTTLHYHPENDPDGDGNLNNEPGLDTGTGGFLAERVIDATADDAPPTTPFAALRESMVYDVHGHLASITDGLGNTTALVHNTVGQLVEARAPAPLRYRKWFHHDADGQLVRYEVENFTANADGFILRVPGNPWIVRTLERDILGRVVTDSREISGREVGPARQAASLYRYDPTGSLTLLIDPLGRRETWIHDERGLLIRHLVHADDGSPAATTNFRHDLSGNRVRILHPEDVDGDGEQETTEFLFDGHDRLAARIDAVGGTTTHTYDAAGRILETAVMGSAGGESPVDRQGSDNVLLSRTRFTLDERGRVVRTSRSRFGPGIDSGEGPTEEVRFVDGRGRSVSRVDATGGTWTFEYDGADQLRRAVGPDGNVTTHDHNAAGSLVRTVVRERSSESIFEEPPDDPEYDDEGRLVTVRSTVFAHDVVGRLVAEIAPSGATRRFIRDSRGNIIMASDAVGTPIAAASDPMLIPILDLLSPQQAATVNTHGNRTVIEYDNLDHPVRVAFEMRENGQGQSDVDRSNPFDSDGQATITYEWDAANRLLSWTGDRGFPATISRDARGAISRIDGPGTMSYTVMRDRMGNPRRIVDRNGNVIHQTFDALGRLVRREIERAVNPGGTGADVEGTTLQIFEWDGTSRLTLAFDDNDPARSSDDAIASRMYDSLGHIVAETANGFVTAIRRDAGGRTTSYRGPAGRRIEMSRDAIGRITALGDEAREYVSYLHIGSERLLDRRLANGVSISYLGTRGTSELPRDTGHELDGEIVRQNWVDPQGNDLLDMEYGHDREGRRLFVLRLHLQQIRGDAYRYDSLGRLRLFIPELIEPRVPPPNPAEFTREIHDGNNNMRFTTVDFVDTITDVDDRDALTMVGETALVSDAAGNLVDDGTRQYRYDFLGRPVRIIENGDTVVSYGHDAVGAQIPEPAGPAGRLVSAGERRLVRLGTRVIEDHRSSGELIGEWIRKDDGTPVVHLAVDETGFERSWYLLCDPVGSVLTVTDEVGEVVEKTRYDEPWGTPRFLNSFGTTIAASPTGNRFLHAGLPFDTDAGMYVIGSRFYSPTLKRFLSPGHAVFGPVAGAIVPTPAITGPPGPLQRFAPAPTVSFDDLPLNQTGHLRAPAPLDINPYVFSHDDPVNGLPVRQTSP